MDFLLFVFPYVQLHLFRQLLLAQLVEGVELAAEDLVVTETGAGQLDSHDDGPVWHHHGHRAKLDLQVLRELLPPRVPRVLSRNNKTPFNSK